MRLKYNFVVRDIENQPVAVAVGKDNARFNGMIRMNRSGAFIFQMLKEDVTVEQIVQRMLERFDVTEEIACEVVEKFLDTLRKDELIIE